MGGSAITKIASKAELKTFGLIFAAFQLTIFGIVLPFVLSLSWPIWPWIVALIFTLVALVVPAFLKWPYIIWMKFGSIMGRINSFIILVFLFYMVITPFGLLFRMLGKDALNRHMDKTAQSYRVRSEPRSKQHYERPY